MTCYQCTYCRVREQYCFYHDRDIPTASMRLNHCAAFLRRGADPTDHGRPLKPSEMAKPARPVGRPAKARKPTL